MVNKLQLKWSRYIPHKPTPKQTAFLLLPHREAFFGGAAGGGKSDALLMAALQYMDVPGYSAIIFRKSLMELKGSGGLLSRANEWLGSSNAKYVASEHSWYFPTRNPDGSEGVSARLEFGYIGDIGVYQKYQGREYQFVGFDEATHQSRYDYLYLFSRLRKCICPHHIVRDETGSPIYDPNCAICKTVQIVPLRIRAASNPGGPGHSWVKERFLILPEKDIAECQRLGIRVRYVGKHPDRPYIPSFVSDNPYLDQQAYYQGLDELDPVTREQLKHGDWGINPDSRFKMDWAKYYSQRGEYFILGRDGIGEAVHHKSLLRIFATVDPAASSREGPAAEVINPEDEPSWTVISIWGLTPNYYLLWLDMVRFRKEIPDVVEELHRVNRMWRPQYFKIEDNGPGKGVYQYALKTGLPVQNVTKIRDKVSNSTDAQIRMKQGRVWFPQTAHWRDIAEGEVFSWTGSPQETDDIVDTLSDAARDVSWEACPMERMDDSDALEGDLGLPDVISEYKGSSGYDPYGYPSLY